jgi:hypothetical protein
MRALLAAAVTAAVVAAGASAAGPVPTVSRTLTATSIRLGQHPAYVRAVVTFAGGPLLAGEVVATDPDPFRDGVVRLPLSRHGVRTTARPARGHGITARVLRRTNRIVVRVDGAPRRFKYVMYRVLHAPERLVVDLLESRPPVAGAQIRRGTGGCLTLDSLAVGPRRLRAAGHERDLFEHGLVVRLRRAGGRIHRERAVTAAAGRWRTSLRYARAARQDGTLEAVALSAKDGTLDCIVQARVRMGG